MLNELKKNKISLAEEVFFANNQASKFKILDKKRVESKKHHEEIVSVTIKYKIRDNNLYCEKLRKKRNWLRGYLESSLGSLDSIGDW